MKKAAKKIGSLALALCMVVGLFVAMPLTAGAVDIQDGKPTITVNTTEIAFAGHQWVVIGDSSSGVTSGNANYVTLLDTGGGFGTSAFRSGSSTPVSGYTQWLTDLWYYEDTYNANPDEYSGSTLLRRMGTIATDIQTASAKEYGLIEPRDIGTDGTAGAAVTNQALWPLSYDEWGTVGNNTVRAYNADWWLRSPLGSPGDGAYVGWAAGASRGNDSVSNDSFAVRPALYLNLSSVLFTSAASATSGKSAATVGSGLVGAAAPTSGAIKFTMTDSTLAPTFTATTDKAAAKPGDTITVTYSNATLSAANQFVSCILQNSGGDILYYGKLADNTGNGTATFTVPTGLANGSYTLKVFNEEVSGQANGHLYTDFASATKDITLTVDTPPTLSNFTATRVSETSAEIIFDSDKDGDYYYIVQEAAAAAPIDTAVQGGALAFLVNGQNSLNISPLTGTGAKKLYIMGKSVAGVWSAMYTVDIPAVPLAQAGQNTVAVGGGNTHTAGQNFTITATGHQQDIVGNNSTTIGTTRYIPISWNINPSGTWAAPPYTVTTSITTPGTYTLTVTYRLDAWDGTAWVNQNNDDTKSTTITIVAASQQNNDQQDSGTTPTGGSPQTGDNSNMPLAMGLAVFSLSGLALCGVYARKKLQRVK